MVQNENTHKTTREKWKFIFRTCSLLLHPPPFEFTYIWILLSVSLRCIFLFSHEVKMYIKRKDLRKYHARLFVCIYGLKPTEAHFWYDTKNVSLKVINLNWTWCFNVFHANDEKCEHSLVAKASLLGNLSHNVDSVVRNQTWISFPLPSSIPFGSELQFEAFVIGHSINSIAMKSQNRVRKEKAINLNRKHSRETFN